MVRSCLSRALLVEPHLVVIRLPVWFLLGCSDHYHLPLDFAPSSWISVCLIPPHFTLRALRLVRPVLLATCMSAGALLAESIRVAVSGLRAMKRRSRALIALKTSLDLGTCCIPAVTSSLPVSDWGLVSPAVVSEPPANTPFLAPCLLQLQPTLLLVLTFPLSPIILWQALLIHFLGTALTCAFVWVELRKAAFGKR